MTVVTQFITEDGTDTGRLSEIRRFYVQDKRLLHRQENALWRRERLRSERWHCRHGRVPRPRSCHGPLAVGSWWGTGLVWAHVLRARLHMSLAEPMVQPVFTRSRADACASHNTNSRAVPESRTGTNF